MGKKKPKTNISLLSSLTSIGSFFGNLSRKAFCYPCWRWFFSFYRYALTKSSYNTKYPITSQCVDRTAPLIKANPFYYILLAIWHFRRARVPTNDSNVTPPCRTRKCYGPYLSSCLAKRPKLHGTFDCFNKRYHGMTNRRATSNGGSFLRDALYEILSCSYANIAQWFLFFQQFINEVEFANFDRNIISRTKKRLK